EISWNAGAVAGREKGNGRTDSGRRGLDEIKQQRTKRPRQESVAPLEVTLKADCQVVAQGRAPITAALACTAITYPKK
ncbi:MAG: hypothetical protein WA772_00645, partial [Candidatus Acidiferrales bacterium]